MDSILQYYKDDNFYRTNEPPDDCVFHIPPSLITDGNIEKGYLYVAESISINTHKKDIYNTKYGIPNFTRTSNKRCIKIGYTKNIVNRMSQYNKDIPDLKLIHKWKIKHPRYLESILIEEYRESNFGGEWFIMSNEEVSNLISSIVDYVDHSYTVKNEQYVKLYKYVYMRV